VHSIFVLQLSCDMKQEVISVLIPCIANHAKEIETGHFKSMFAKFQASAIAVELTRSEIACLLANAFLCKFPFSGNCDENLNFTR
jgi:Poly (ADP-ribose) glycohydrolase (PARG)